MISILVATLTASAADWPAWLGPDRNGISRETGIAAVWTGAGPRELWRASPGKGISSMAVVDGVVFTMADEASGEYVDALETTTGSLRWRTQVDAPYIDHMGFHGPRATPTVVGDRVVSLSGRGTLFALSRTNGNLLWSVDLVEGLGGQRPTWGYSGSPLVADGRVYVGVGAEEGRGVAAFSLSDGRELWHTGA